MLDHDRRPTSPTRSELLRRLACAALLGASTLAAQRVHVVDASGNSGQYKTISAAVAAARDSDSIHVKKGVYAEYVDLDGKAVNILGIAPRVDDVLIAGPTFGWRPALLMISNLPAGRVTRIARLRIAGFNHTSDFSIALSNSQGKVVFDALETHKPWSLRAHRGTIGIANLRVATGLTMMSAEDITNLFMHNCRLESTQPNGAPTSSPAARFTNCYVELDRCRIIGPDVTFLAKHDGGAGLELNDSTARITGLSTDVIRGGVGRTISPKAGGPAVRLSNSSLVWSGASITRAGGSPPGPRFVTTNGSTVTEQRPRAPVVVMPSSYARNQVTRTTIHATPGALSLTYIAIDFQPFRTPFGSFLIDPNLSLVRGIYKHDAKGEAYFDLDLRGLPSTFVSEPYVVQAFTLDTNSNLGVSAPHFGVIGS